MDVAPRLSCLDQEPFGWSSAPHVPQAHRRLVLRLGLNVFASVCDFLELCGSRPSDSADLACEVCLTLKAVATLVLTAAPIV